MKFTNESCDESAPPDPGSELARWLRAVASEVEANPTAFTRGAWCRDSFLNAMTEYAARPDGAQSWCAIGFYRRDRWPLDNSPFNYEDFETVLQQAAEQLSGRPYRYIEHYNDSLTPLTFVTWFRHAADIAERSI